jgi:6-phosphogluconate dehydrogenase
VEKKCDIGVVGLAVMGANLALNMADCGFSVAVYNRTPEKTREFLLGSAPGKDIVAAGSLAEMAKLLVRPRKILLMVKAGKPVDDVIDTLLPLLLPGDCIIDGGNSHFADTQRRAARVESAGMLYVGCGVSGGEAGARNGPSLMPGGTAAAWPMVRPVLQKICAKAPDGTPCCDWVGPDGSGHFVKMVHNGIEYGDLQLIGESYQFLRDGLGFGAAECSEIFARWNKGELESYLIKITGDILEFQGDDGAYLVDRILDVAAQKGTGAWVAASSLDLGVPVTLIAEAVFARFLSSARDERTAAAAALKGPDRKVAGDRNLCIADLEGALFASKIVSYAQGFMLLRAASAAFSWNLDLGKIALLWRAGCIIRSGFLDRIHRAFAHDKNLSSLVIDGYFRNALAQSQDGWRKTMSAAAFAGIPMPALSAALSFYDGYRCDRLPANLLQAQRDYFGAHGYERVDGSRGKFIHTDWIGGGGTFALGSRNA